MTLNQLFTSIANAIRTIKGTQATIKAAQFPQEIESIELGITPTGTISITENGITDVTTYANADVNIGQLVIRPKVPNTIRFQNSGASNMDWVMELDWSEVTQFSNMFYGNNQMVTAPYIDTKNMIDFTGAFRNCMKLENVPVYDTSGNTYDGGLMTMFSNCSVLTDESLNNIMMMCINCPNVSSWARKLEQLGLTKAQTDRCKTLSNYSAFLAAGWTTGY